MYLIHSVIGCKNHMGTFFVHVNQHVTRSIIIIQRIYCIWATMRRARNKG